ncbi:neuroglobin-like [Mytilus galloprovincialis]|uniref:Globin domain-containing protein n=1 Tax=Mytilus galloprovincialis TaxID=29158 RepID=A0A8B6GNE0_MYTGA|nr:Hypothetical predicted protein [Mytilus galloprovincialis]
MGCDGSKVADVIDTNPDVPPEENDFSELVTDTIRSTWPLLSDDIENTGIKVFLRIFYEEPKIRNVFKRFGEMDEIELRRSPIFKEHAYRFMRVVDDLVDSMDQPKTHIQQNLMMLGAKHATFEGFRIEYFEAYSKSLIDVWEYTIGEEFIPEVRESWTEFFDYLVKYMCQGYNVFINETDVTCNGDDHFRFE